MERFIDVVSVESRSFCLPQNRDGVLSIPEAVHGFEQLAQPLDASGAVFFFGGGGGGWGTKRDPRQEGGLHSLLGILTPFLSLSLSLALCPCLSIYLSACLAIYVCLFIYLAIYISIYLPICLSIH